MTVGEEIALGSKFNVPGERWIKIQNHVTSGNSFFHPGKPDAHISCDGHVTVIAVDGSDILVLYTLPNMKDAKGIEVPLVTYGSVAPSGAKFVVDIDDLRTWQPAGQRRTGPKDRRIP